LRELRFREACAPPRPRLFPYTTLFRSLDAEPEERQARLGQDRGGNAERHGHEHGRHRVREDMAPDDPEAARAHRLRPDDELALLDRKSTRLNSSHVAISYAVFCLKKKR